ncbi:MAG TPA: sensor domain-containing diguanylate cyclase [Candidatus Elarobacter sp.]|jgi:diguanylate cyclase (GGDEF)-like protein|nr:sensor domain-containing diguanylate cyclase [Candidatus Elarobacter sp.]
MPTQTDEPIVQADMMVRRARKRDVVAAALFVAVLLAVTMAGAHWGNMPGPVVPPFIPIVATFWGAADLLTAFLLFTQFLVNGIRAFAYLGGAYAYVGLLTIPYVAFFPGLFPEGSPVTSQVSVWLWLVWHLIFPLIIASYRLYDPDFRRRFLEGSQIRRGLNFALLCVIAGAALTTAIVVPFDTRLPVLYAHGAFALIWIVVFTPLVFVLNAGAAILIVGFGRKPRLLQLWLAVALAASALDGLINAFVTTRYTWNWYLSKVETLLTATIVMCVLLLEVGALYRRLGTMAIVDPLTGLRNRRSFDEYVQWTLGQRRRAELALLVLDVDCFKQYNDRYGHAAGDVALQQVAEVLRSSLLRSVDLAARYGGEEFVVLLPDATAGGAQDVAERIRQRVQALAIAHDGSQVAPVVTVSLGVAHAFASSALEVDELFAQADRALYSAKERRNATVLAESIVSPGTTAAS